MAYSLDPKKPRPRPMTPRGSEFTPTPTAAATRRAIDVADLPASAPSPRLVALSPRQHHRARASSQIRTKTAHPRFLPKPRRCTTNLPASPASDNPLPFSRLPETIASAPWLASPCPSARPIASDTSQSSANTPNCAPPHHNRYQKTSLLPVCEWLQLISHPHPDKITKLLQHSGVFSRSRINCPSPS